MFASKVLKLLLFTPHVYDEHTRIPEQANMVMPYNLNPHEHDGLGGLPLWELERLVVNYYDEAHKYEMKVLFHMASMQIDCGGYTNATPMRLTAAVEMIKDHPAVNQTHAIPRQLDL